MKIEYNKKVDGEFLELAMCGIILFMSPPWVTRRPFWQQFLLPALELAHIKEVTNAEPKLNKK